MQRMIIISMKELFKSESVKEINIPLTIGFLEITSFVVWLSTWRVCYKYKPLRKIIKHPLIKKYLNIFKHKYINFYHKYENIYSKYEKKILNKSQKTVENIKLITVKMNIDSNELVNSFGENIILYNLLYPFIFFIQICCIVQYSRNKDKRITNEKNHPEENIK